MLKLSQEQPINVCLRGRSLPTIGPFDLAIKQQWQLFRVRFLQIPNNGFYSVPERWRAGGLAPIDSIKTADH
jgi:hypothetical protein